MRRLRIHDSRAPTTFSQSDGGNMSLAPRWSPYVWLAIALSIVSWRIVRFEVISHRLGENITLNLQIFKVYNHTILLSNYFTEGLVRRGLQGSVFYLFRNYGFENSQIYFHLFIAVWLCIPLLIILIRLAQNRGRAWIWLSLVLVLSPQLFMAWARDVAKADMLAEGLIVWALVACLSRRYMVAAVIVFVASQVHEIGLIYGGPLCVAMGFLDYRAGEAKLSRGVAALGLLGVLLIAALGGAALFGPTPQAMARDMLANVPNPNVSAFLGIYMT